MTVRLKSGNGESGQNSGEMPVGEFIAFLAHKKAGQVPPEIVLCP